MHHAAHDLVLAEGCRLERVCGGDVVRRGDGARAARRVRDLQRLRRRLRSGSGSELGLGLGLRLGLGGI